MVAVSLRLEAYYGNGLNKLFWGRGSISGAERQSWGLASLRQAVRSFSGPDARFYACRAPRRPKIKAH